MVVRLLAMVVAMCLICGTEIGVGPHIGLSPVLQLPSDSIRPLWTQRGCAGKKLSLIARGAAPTGMSSDWEGRHKNNQHQPKRESNRNGLSKVRLSKKMMQIHIEVKALSYLRLLSRPVCLYNKCAWLIWNTINFRIFDYTLPVCIIRDLDN